MKEYTSHITAALAALTLATVTAQDTFYGGSPHLQWPDYTYGQPLGWLPTATRAGYEFKGWDFYSANPTFPEHFWMYGLLTPDIIYNSYNGIVCARWSNPQFNAALNCEGGVYCYGVAPALSNPLYSWGDQGFGIVTGSEAHDGQSALYMKSDWNTYGGAWMRIYVPPPGVGTLTLWYRIIHNEGDFGVFKWGDYQGDWRVGAWKKMTIPFNASTDAYIEISGHEVLVDEVVWTPKPVTLTVTFNPNAGVVSPTSKSVTTGKTYGTLPTPTRTGYTFDGWFTGLTDGTEVTAATIVTEPSSHTLYAWWTEKTLTVTFNDGTSTQTSTQTYGSDYVLPPDPTRVGYTFAGWWTAASGGTQITASTAVSIIANQTLYARWTANTYTVTFDPQGGTVSPTSKAVTFGTAYGTLPTPSKDDWYFAGWWRGTDGTGARVSASTRHTTAGHVTLYAYWVNDPALAQAPYLSEPNGAGAAPTIATAYDGFLYDDNNTVRGTMTLNAKAAVKLDKKTGIATTNWTFSAKAVLQTASISFSGKTNGVVERFTAATKTGTLDVHVEGERFYGTLVGQSRPGEPLATFHVDGAKNDKATRVPGLYNVALLSGGGIPAAVAGGTEASATVGYVSLSVGNAGAVKYAGQLADGAKVSGSAKLLAGLNRDGWYAVALFKPLYSKNGFLSGLLWLNPADWLIRVDWENDWFVDWKKASGNPDRLGVGGGYFGTGKQAVMPPLGLTFGVSVPDSLPRLFGPWHEEKFPSGLEVFTSGTKLSLAKKGPSNPSGATLSYNAKTGVFKGKFSLFCTDFSGRDKATSVPYAGVMRPQDDGRLSGEGIGTATINKVKFGIPVFLEK